MGRVSPHHLTRGLGSVVSSPSGVRGGALAENGFYAYEVRNEPHGTHFSVFLSAGGDPKRRGARENFPPFHPLDGPVTVGQLVYLMFVFHE